MAVEETILDKLDKIVSQRKFEKYSQKAYNFLLDTARKLYGANTGAKVYKDQVRTQQYLKGGFTANHIGQMFFYNYDAVGKDTKQLPYFDEWPLIMLVNADSEHFYGLNFHYLPPKLRAFLFQKLLTLANKSTIDEKTRLRLSYKLLNGVGKFSLFKPCFKKYRKDHVRSRLVRIDPTQWETVLFLPTAKFYGATNSQVWSDSVLKTKKD